MCVVKMSENCNVGLLSAVMSELLAFDYNLAVAHLWSYSTFM